MTTAAIYLRVSLDPEKGTEREGLAVERQRADCKRIAYERGWSVVATYEDNSISASKAERVRPEYDRMLADHEAGKFEALVCWDLDRLTRQPRQLEDWVDRAEHGGLMIVTANGEADLSTDGGRMYARIKAAVARAEVERKGARQREANKQLTTKLGDVYGRKRQWGWKDLKCRELDPEAAALIIKAVDDILEGKATSEVAAGWNSAGVLAPGGKSWLAATVRATLLRPANAGIVTYKGEEYRDVPAQWTPLFPIEKLDALKAVLKSRGHASGKKLKPTKSLLGGLMLCGKCGSTMQQAPRTDLKTGRRIIEYRCSGRTHRCYRSYTVEYADAQIYGFLAGMISFHGVRLFVDEDRVERLKELNVKLDHIAQERSVVASSKISVSSRVAMLTDIDSREDVLRAEAAGVTKGSAIASLIADLAGIRDPQTRRASLSKALERRTEIETRIRALSNRQQRMLVEEFGDYILLDRHAEPRIQILEKHPLD